MDFDVPKVKLILQTKDISTSDDYLNYPISNTKGYINQYRTHIKWNAVNLRNVLGSLWDEYELFSIQFSNLGWSNNLATTYGVSADDLNISYGIAGLDWVYANYSTSKGNCVSETIMNGNIFNGTANSCGMKPYEGMTAIFRKQSTADISIKLYTVNGTLPNMNANTIWPQMIFDFTITPIK